ncbi:MAG: nucleotidyltransferase family protein [Vulcanimicrobiaceae bacterium]
MIAAITAGGRVDGEFAAAIGTEVKALAPLRGGTVLDVVLAAAAEAGAARLVVVGGEEVRARYAPRVDRVIAESPYGRENLRLALEAAGDDELLLLTSDLPFVGPSDVRAFVARSRGYDVAMPLVSDRAYREAFPGAPPHDTQLGAERVVNGNAFYFAPGAAPRTLAAAQHLFDARKSLWRMAGLLGPVLLLRFAFGRLRVEHIEARAATTLGLRTHAVRDQAPQLCYDIDSLEDYRYALDFAGQV